MRRLALALALWSRFKQEARMLWGLLRHPATPLGSRLAAIFALAYLLAPLDLIPDVLPFVGWIDDGIIAGGLLWLAFRLLPVELHDALRRRAGGVSEPIDAAARRVG
jgi:uncharacterized membrane protein YkvA (DUF1232 family)